MEIEPAFLFGKVGIRFLNGFHDRALDASGKCFIQAVPMHDHGAGRMMGMSAIDQSVRGGNASGFFNLGGDGIELARVLMTGDVVGPQLFLQDGVAWLLVGSVGADPLRRTVGLHRALLARGEAQLHNAHGLEDYAAGELDAARREFGRSIAADPSYVDGLYNAAAAAALTGRAEEAVELLARAAAVDPARVQVLGRNDQDFKSLRRRPDVRALLGLRRPPPEGIPPPP